MTKIGTVLLAVLPALLVGVAKADVGHDGHDEGCPACRYEQEDEGDCFEYSQTVSGAELAFWPKATDFCLATLGVEERILKLDLFWAMCPFPNRTNVDYTEIVSFLQAEPDHPIAHEIKELFADRGIFAITPLGTYELPQNITTSSNQAFIDCTVTQALCWGEVRVEMEGRKQKINSLCSNLHERQTTALKSEQAIARQLLCEGDPVQACNVLSDKIQQEKPFGGDCSPFGVSIPNDALPLCEHEPDPSSGGFSLVSSIMLVGMNGLAIMLVISSFM
eukprot:CAMPEP_0172475618 /NCGR_PEP_ID=MMETSP1065-20121228/69963_1 /TAXON_ID=265537 /ORGANISM="Amphiprora paludosa, Strain CCMP125" /LENGTH=276 /DNA_ID=CAMNT_0013233829 /DNA_START=49 /DNA_END=879 /DNA_ORIENTATION=+